MRKHGRTLVFALLLLLVPVLANAWTLTVRVNGSSSAGEVTITYTDTLGVSQDKVILAGTEYVQVKNGMVANVLIEPNGNNAADAYLDYVKQEQVTGEPFAFPVPGDTGNHQLTVNFATAADAKANVSVSKTAGGTTLVQYNGVSSMTGFSNLVYDTTIGIKASPRSDYKVTSILVSQTDAGGSLIRTLKEVTPLPGDAGLAQTTSYKINMGSYEEKYIQVQAEYELVPTFKLALAAPLKAVAGKDVTLNAAGTTSNTGISTYTFTLKEKRDSGVYVDYGTPLTATAPVSFVIWPKAGVLAGDYEVSLVVTAADGTVSAPKTAKITVVSEAAAYNNLCLGCHTGSTPDVIADYIAGTHGLSGSNTTACIECHTSSPHNAHPAITDGASCGTCHARPATHYGGTAFHKAQYVSDASLPVSCANCHGNPVNVIANTTILEQFAASAHGDPAGEAWRHYDWRSASRSACARCHAGTAFVAKLGNENNTTNAYQPSDILKPGEVLNCSACHTDAGTGALRGADGSAQTFTINMTNGAVTYQVPGASALCARCHGGRETGASIKADPSTTGVRGFIDPHYLAAAGILYNNGGYHYDGQTYGSLGDKKLLGTGAQGQGPCVACHMGTAKDHTFVAAGNATAKASFATALNGLKTALETEGIYYAPVHPYFFTAPYKSERIGGLVPTNVAVTNWGIYGVDSWKDTMGAAFNYALLVNEPGAYAHNPEYALKLIEDSIDFLVGAAQ